MYDKPKERLHLVFEKERGTTRTRMLLPGIYYRLQGYLPDFRLLRAQPAGRFGRKSL